MKFGKELDRLAIPEWKTQYIRYEELKDLIDVLAEQDTPPPVADCPFLKMLTKMVGRVNNFYVSQEATMTGTWNALKAQLEKIEVADRNDDDDDDDDNRKRSKRAKKPKSKSVVRKKKMKGRRSTVFQMLFPTMTAEKEVKGSVEEFYLAIDKLLSYKQLNETAIRKILKKYDKNLKRSVSKQLLAKFGALPCFQSHVLAEIESDVVNAYTIYFTENSRRMAMAHLRVPAQRFTGCPWQILGAGVLLGIAALSMVVLGVAMAHSDKIEMDHSRRLALFVIFRGLFVFALYPLLLSVDFYIFAKMGINFRLMMQMSQRNAKVFRLWVLLLSIGAFTLAVWGLAAAASALSPYVGPHAAAWAPLVTFACIVLAVTNPIAAIRANGFPTPLLLMGRIMLAPLYSVQFADFWAADQLTSLVRPMLDLEFAVYYYFYAYDAAEDDSLHLSVGHKVLRGVLASAPYTWRLLQCVRRYRDMPIQVRSFHPHLTNGLKYTSTFFVIWFSLLTSHYKGSNGVELEDDKSKIFFALWIVAAIVNMCFTLSWDFWMDWGVLRSRDEPLRAKIMFPPPVYAAAIVYNVFGRVAWVLTVSVGFFDSPRYDFLGLALSVVEIVRRSSWNLFRFEIEHLFNCGKLRATTLEFFPAVHTDHIQKTSSGLFTELSFPTVEGPDDHADVLSVDGTHVNEEPDDPTDTCADATANGRPVAVEETVV